LPLDLSAARLKNMRTIRRKSCRKDRTPSRKAGPSRVARGQVGSSRSSSLANGRAWSASICIKFVSSLLRGLSMCKWKVRARAGNLRAGAMACHAERAARSSLTPHPHRNHLWSGETGSAAREAPVRDEGHPQGQPQTSSRSGPRRVEREHRGGSVRPG
jgi:hypothetical protein